MLFKTSVAVALATVVTQVVGHGLVTSIEGANGVSMPGLGLMDGTPRDCTTKNCGAQDDTPVFKEGNGPLGSTRAGGAVSAEDMVKAFMGMDAAAAAAPAAGAAAANKANANAKANAADAAEDAADAKDAKKKKRRGLLDNLLGKADAGAAGNAAGAGAAGAAGAGGLATGTKTAQGTKEQSVAAAAGKGADAGMPTVGADGVITMNFHQVNGDGAGPYTAAVDATSGGTDEAAFKPATVMMNIPGRRGNDNQGRTSDFQMQVQMPAGMQCQGTIAGMQNLCVVRVKNPANAGPFGGSAVFTQEQPAAAAAPAAAGAANAAAAPAAAGAANAAAAPAAAGAANEAAAAGTANKAAGAGTATGTAKTAAAGAAAQNAAGAAGAAKGAAAGTAAGAARMLNKRRVAVPLRV